MIRLFEQIIGEHLPLRPDLFLKLRLLGFTAEVEVWKHAMLFRLDFLSEPLRYRFGDMVQTAIPACFIRQENAEVDRPIPAPVRAEGVTNSHNVSVPVENSPVSAD